MCICRNGAAKRIKRVEKNPDASDAKKIASSKIRTPDLGLPLFLFFFLASKYLGSI